MCGEVKRPGPELRGGDQCVSLAGRAVQDDAAQLAREQAVLRVVVQRAMRRLVDRSPRPGQRRRGRPRDELEAEPRVVLIGRSGEARQAQIHRRDDRGIFGEDPQIDAVQRIRAAQRGRGGAHVSSVNGSR